MKKMIISLVSGALLASTVNAAQLYVSDLEGIAKYITLQEAHDAASGGDTIIVGPMWQNTYQNLNLLQPLVIMGMGDKSLSTLHNNTGGIATLNLNPSAAGSKIIGCNINGFGGSSSNISFEKSSLAGGSLNVDNGVIVNCRINSNSYTLTNGLVSNTIFTDMYGGDWSGTTINHCMISLRDAVVGGHFTNNVINRSSDGLPMSSQYTNNIFTAGTSIGAATGSGNKFLVNDITLKLFTTGTFGADYANDATLDYRLKAGSLGKAAGTDGQDLGIYGGNYPWTSEPNEPRYRFVGVLPKVTMVGITTPAMVVGDTLKATITGKRVQ